MKSFSKGMILGALLFVPFLSGEALAAWSNLGGGDHGGADWTLGSGVIAGTHTNIGTFTIPSGVTVTVKPYDGAGFGGVSIDAENITINGTLSAVAAGYGGGGGGGGGTGAGGPDWGCSREENVTGEFASGGIGLSGGEDGGDGTKIYPPEGHVEGSSIGGDGGSGGGDYGGAGGVGVQSDYNNRAVIGNAGSAGGYAALMANGDGTIDESLRIGSGGGGGGGGACSYEEAFSSVGGSGGGGAGGSGGGAVRLVAKQAITVAGKILTTGRAGGGNGEAGTDGQYKGLPCDLQGIGGKGASASASATTATGGAGVYGYIVSNLNVENKCISDMRDMKFLCNYFDKFKRYSISVPGGSGGAGGAGAGGGVLLKASTIKTTGTIDAKGGSGVSNGGTVKVFYCSTPTLGGSISAGRVYTQKRTDCYVDIGLRVHDGSGIVAVATQKADISNFKVYWNNKNQEDFSYYPYSVALVDSSDPYASKIRIKTSAGEKRLRVCGYLTAATANTYVDACY